MIAMLRFSAVLSQSLPNI